MFLREVTTEREGERVKRYTNLCVFSCDDEEGKVDQKPFHKPRKEACFWMDSSWRIVFLEDEQGKSWLQLFLNPPRSPSPPMALLGLA